MPLSPGWLQRPLRSFLRPLAGVAYDTQVEGIDNVPAEGPVIIAPNHLSFFDTPLLMVASPRPVVFLGKAEYLDRWHTRHLFPALGMVPIRRQEARSSMAALTTAADLLGEGRMVGIYPEGTRSRDGLLHKGHTGVAHLALVSGAPILPIGLVGTDAVQPIGAAVPRLRGSLRIRVGEPLDPGAYRAGGRRRRRGHLTDDVMAAIAALTDQERSPDFSDGEPPLIRGGSESVYRVVRTRGLSTDGWAAGARAAVASTCTRYDDARVGEVRHLGLRIGSDGSTTFVTDISVSVKFRGAATPAQPRLPEAPSARRTA